MNGIANEHSSGRRRFFQATFAGVVLLIAGRAGIAHAEPTKAPNQSPGELKSSCDKHGGVYIESKKDDVQACFWDNKGKTVCKFNGTGCYNYDPPKRLDTTGPFADPFGNVNWQALAEVAGVEDPDAVVPVTSPAINTPATTQSRGRHKRRGKRRKR